jgi:hypothetical protein
MKDPYTDTNRTVVVIEMDRYRRTHTLKWIITKPLINPVDHHSGVVAGRETGFVVAGGLLGRVRGHGPEEKPNVGVNACSPHPDIYRRACLTAFAHRLDRPWTFPCFWIVLVICSPS